MTSTGSGDDQHAVNRQGPTEKPQAHSTSGPEKPARTTRSVFLTNLFWTLLGALIGATLDAPATMLGERLVQIVKGPEARLAEAKTARAVFSEADLLASIEIYDSLARDPRARGEALRGLSRAYADLATLRYWRGVSPIEPAERAYEYAREALSHDSNDVENDLALAFAYASAELLSPTKLATRNKVLELMAKKVDSIDLRYLAWFAKAREQDRDFYKSLSPKATEDFRILIQGAMNLVEMAATTDDEALSASTIRRAEEFLAQAELVSRGNTLVDFVRGYLFLELHDELEAEQSFRRAIDNSVIFPRARNNLAVIYARKGDYQGAAEQLEGALRSISLADRRTQLYNLGFTLLELGDERKSCDVWREAAGLPHADELFYASMGLAFCSYTEESFTKAAEHFGTAVEKAKGLKIDFLDAGTFAARGAGPRELAIARELIRLATVPASSGLPSREPSG